ncbi:hypothetical protein TraAM80_01428 [Trypanosoma rangeli]|uniref:Leucine-rich repeat protein (LRRP) n=1 Tax=Trypanosoma rangeli TaxID=5698 RepID=A0A3S5ISC3_TRYRA|nr:uncharacterized protein TraAM80_01428 [Trypanosoma rangeli]RNF10612.1 hypothetical protein TraAM80_01428 [Trypanosoma rangeli]|eukprot:RNF10612.1 hypothetical protein TraAM80_01428 [Trypanosoma rangeli]
MLIDLSRRKLIDFDPTAFSTEEERKMLHAITRLDVSCNSLSSLYGMRWLSMLTSLDVSNNNVAFLHGLPLSLRQLNASSNVLTEVDGLSPLLQLEVLVVSHNQITTLEGLPAAVRILDASCNRIASLTGLEKCTSLEELQVRQNMIQHVEGLSPIQFLPSLKAATLAENPVTNSKRRLAAVHAMLPPTLQVVDLPSWSWMKTSSGPSSSSLVVSLNTTTMQDSVNLSCFSSVSTVRQGKDASTRGSPSLSPASCSHMPVRTTLQREKQKHSHAGSDMTCCMTATNFTTPSPAAVVHNNVLSSSDTTHYYSRLEHASRDVNAMQVPQRQAFTEVDISLPSIRAQRLLQSMVEHLQYELDTCRRSCLIFKRENGDLKLCIQQLQSINEYQARMNAILVEKNDKLERICFCSSPLKQTQILATSTDVKNHVEGDGVAHAPPTSREQLLELSSSGKGDLGKEAIEIDPQHPYVEGPSEQATLAETKAELRRGARSLAALFMSLVPKPARDRPHSSSASTAGAANCNGSYHPRTIPQHGEDTSCINANAENALKDVNAGDKGRKRTVSFGGFAYYSPSP